MPARSQPAATHFTRHAIARAVFALSLSSLGLAPHTALAADTGIATTRVFAIPAGSLEQVLNRFALEAGILLTIDGNATSGKHSNGLSGQYGAESGFARLLENSGLIAVRTNTGYLVTRHAANHADAAALPTVVVTASQAPKTATSEDTGSYIVHASTIGKVAVPLKEIPQSVSVLTRRQIEDQNLKTVDEALRQVTGVTTNLYGDGTAGYTSRAYALDVQYDGIPASSALQMVSQFDLAMYDRVEVLRGPNGLLQGAGSPSGTVNFVRKRPTRDFKLSTAVSAGSHSDYHAEADISGALNDSGSVRARAVVAGQDRDFATAVKHNTQYTGYAIVEMDSSPNTTWSLSAAYQHKNAQRFMGIPTRSDTKQLVDASPSTFFGADGGHSRYPMQEVVADVEHRFGDTGWKANASLRQKNMTSDLLYGYISGTVSANNTARVTLARTYYKESNLGLDVHADGPFSLLGRQHSALIGYNAEQYRYEGGSKTTSLSGQSIYNHSYNLDAVGPITSKSARELQQSGFYGAGRFNLSDPLMLVLGGRVSDYTYKTRTVAPTPGAWKESSATTGQVTPYAGLIWKLSGQHNYYLSYTDIFTPQDDVYDSSNARLAPKTGWQVETGLKSELLDGRLNTAVSLYRIREKNRAILDSTHSDCGGTGNDCYTAAGLVQSQGLDIEAIGQLTTGWNLSAGYSYNDNRYLKDAVAANVGTRYATTTPRHSAKLWSNYRLPGTWNRFRIGGGLQWQSKTGVVLSNGGELKQGSYAVAGLQGSYRVAANSELTVTVNNLFDRRYYERLRSTWGYNYYGDPRSVTLTLRSKF